jgi:hypothetical protein
MHLCELSVSGQCSKCHVPFLRSRSGPSARTVFKFPALLATWVGVAALSEGTILLHHPSPMIAHSYFFSMSSVEILPPELLGAVFQQLVESKLEHSSGTVSSPAIIQRLLLHHRSRLRILVTISLVCRRWHALVSDDGTLWTHIPVDASRHDCWKSTKCLLIRSKDTVLDVSAALEAPHVLSSAAVMALSVHYARIRSLHLSTDSYVTLFDGPEPATEMRTLAIFNRNKLHYSVSRFGGTFPSLQSLTLHGFSFSFWPSGLFPNLKHVKLKSVSASRSVKLSCIVDLLRESPGIETLYLASFLLIVDDSSHTNVIHLRNLRKISLRVCDSAMILSRLAIPRTSAVDIVMDHKRLRETKLILPHESHIISSLPPALSNMGFSDETTKLVLEQDHLRGGFGLGLSFLNADTSSLVIIDCSSSVGRFVQRSLVAISSHPYFEIIQSATLTLSPSIPISWPNLLGRFNQLVELNTSACHGPAVLTTLMRLRHDGTPFCSSLTRVRFFERNPVFYSILDHRLLQLLSNFRASFHCKPIKVTVHDGNGSRIQCFVCYSGVP